MFKTALLACSMLALAGTGVLAANNATVSKDGRLTTVQQAAHSFVARQPHDLSKTTFFDNIGTKYPKGAYWCCTGGTISGPNSQIGAEYWDAVAFTPAASGSVTEIEAAVGYVNGTNGVTISLYSDASGIPGTALWSKDVSNLPAFGACCTVAAAKDKAGVSVTAGTQYWVVIQTDSKTATTWDAFNDNDSDQVDGVPSAYYSSGIWTSYTGAPTFAIAVYGN